MKATKINNPYSVVNMRLAYNRIKNSFQNETLDLTPTHLYVKFMPENDNQLSLLKYDTGLILYDYPLDYTPIEGLISYHDPSIPEEQPTFQYASVPVSFLFPDVPYQILDDLYIPEDDALLYASHELMIDSLINESLRLTNNLAPEETKGKEWRPKGTIKLTDLLLGDQPLPLEGVKVRARRFVHTHTGITNRNGYYECDGTFKYAVNYSFQWERYDFEIRDSWLGTAKYDGPYRDWDWDLDITSGIHNYYGTIFKAAHHYYYKDVQGLRRPPENAFWKTQLKIRAFYETNNEDNGSHCPSCRFLGLGSAIKIYNPQRTSDEIYGTVIHELAHASHWNMDSWHYNHCEDVVAESWARGVQWGLTRMIYENYQPPYNQTYTGVVQDMIDGIGGYDQVVGYSIRQIEDALLGELYWQNWRMDIQNTYTNATENYLESLFSFWHT